LESKGLYRLEKSQDFGTKARQFTSNYFRINEEVKNTDRYGRKIGLALLPNGSTGTIKNMTIPKNIQTWKVTFKGKDWVYGQRQLQ
jgi:hypothetical protein